MKGQIRVSGWTGIGPGALDFTVILFLLDSFFLWDLCTYYHHLEYFHKYRVLTFFLLFSLNLWLLPNLSLSTLIARSLLHCLLWFLKNLFYYSYIIILESPLCSVFLIFLFQETGTQLFSSLRYYNRLESDTDRLCINICWLNECKWSKSDWIFSHQFILNVWLFLQEAATVFNFICYWEYWW